MEEANIEEETLRQSDTASAAEESASASAEADYREMNDKYLRLYAEFDNYRKRMQKEKEDLIKYGNENLLYEILPALDNLELALKHAVPDAGSGLVQGVEMTFKEIIRTLEKFGLVRIESVGKPFDPAVHHAMMQVERPDMDEKMVAEEMRAGYMYREKVLRPSLVSVSVKPKSPSPESSDAENVKDDQTINSTVKEEQ